jgi:hypothetical protein
MFYVFHFSEWRSLVHHPTSGPGHDGWSLSLHLHFLLTELDFIHFNQMTYHECSICTCGFHTYLYAFITDFYLYIFHFLIKELQNKWYRKYSLKCSFPNQPPPCHVICSYAWCVKVYQFWRYGSMCSWWLMVTYLLHGAESFLRS